MLYHIWYNMCMNDSLKILPARFFKTASGTEPVREWLKGLDKEDSRIIGGEIRKHEKNGPLRVRGGRSYNGDKKPWGEGSRMPGAGSATGMVFNSSGER